MKYNYNKELRLIANFHAPFHSWLFPISDNLIKMLPRGLHSTKDVIVTKHYIKSRDEYNIPVYEFNPNDGIKKKKAIICFHGGGFAFGFCKYQTELAKQYAILTNSKAFFVDYRLASKHPYPTPFYDCLDSYIEIVGNKDKYQIDDSFIIITGDSAGGCLAFDVTNYICKNNKNLKPNFLMLIYPVMDKSNSSISCKMFKDTAVWNSTLNSKMWNEYLRNYKNYVDPINQEIDEFVNTHIEVCEFDCLKDEGLAMYEKLSKLNIPVSKHITMGACHGFELRYRTNITKNAIINRVNIINQAIKDGN